MEPHWPSPHGDVIVAIEKTPVGPGESRDVTVVVRQGFSLKKVVIPSTTGTYFELVDLRVQGESQFVVDPASTGVPAIVFSESAHFPPGGLKMGDCPAGGKICLTVRNTSAAAQDFTGALIGPRLEALPDRVPPVKLEEGLS